MAVSGPRPRRRGLVVCCCHPHSPFALQAPEHDATFYVKLLRQSGFEVRTLSDRKLGLESSTRCNIIRGIEWLVSEASPGDSLVFVFLGHGTAIVRTSYERRDCLDRALCTAIDSQSGTAPTSSLSFIADTEFQALFALVPAGALLTCVLDCPYGETVLKLPWYYNAKMETFCHVPQAVQHSAWPGDRYRQGEGVDYLIRGVRPDCKAQNPPWEHSSSRVIKGPQELFPGVTAFLLCACRPDQVCFESTGVESRPQGIFSSSLATALLQRLRGPCTYLDLARCVQEQVQHYMMETHLSMHGLAQDILLGFNSDPKNVFFLQAPTESIILQPNPFQLDATSVYSNVLVGASGIHRWPHVLLQLCRLGGNASKLMDARALDESKSTDTLKQAILACEVVGECWLPPLHQLFPEISALDGRPNGNRASNIRFGGDEYRCQHTLSLELKEPSFGTRTHHYTYAASIPSHLVNGSLLGQRALPTRPDIACFDNTLEWLNNHLSSRTEQTYSGARAGLACRSDVGFDELKERIASVYGGNVRAFMRCADVHGNGEVNATEFEWACKRRLGMDINVARRAFEECLRLSSRRTENTLLTSSLCLALQEQETHASQWRVSTREPLQVHMTLGWTCGNTDAASLHFENLEVCQKPPLSAADYLANGVANIRPNADSLSRTCANWTRANPGRPDLTWQESEAPFFLRTCLCAVRGDMPNESESQIPSELMPHLAHVSNPLWNGTRPDSGELYLRLLSDIAKNGRDANSMVPVCTMKRLCELQQEAFSIRPDVLGKVIHGSCTDTLGRVQQPPLHWGPHQCSRELQAPELPRYACPIRTMSDPDLTKSLRA